MARSTIVFDLETIADPEAAAMLPPVEPDSRLKDPAKIVTNIQEKEEKRKTELGLNPATGRICCFGFWYDGKADYHLLDDNWSSGEQDLLKQIWELLNYFDHFVTFNGQSFDIPFLLFRSLKNRVRPAVKIDLARYRITNHTDVWAVLTNWNTYQSGSNLDLYSRILLGKSSKDEMTGADVQDYWDDGRKQEIANYCMGDCQATAEIYRLIQKYYLL
jgi:predicted PolB exonuclease-like 3'-5' exonuclease